MIKAVEIVCGLVGAGCLLYLISAVFGLSSLKKDLAEIAIRLETTLANVEKGAKADITAVIADIRKHL